ncbi:H-NS family nucleoid-associated regulatory protein [Burkholderia anthina]|uniref:H-NS histone family protein n=1 Tax=Burkholderia anthina TaxID=179879 RepID=UPI00158B88DB|nr:H-NS histone family protein [Burkholderia anthina]
MSNDSLRELLVRMVELDAQIAKRRAVRRNEVVDQIVILMREYDIDLRIVERRLSSFECLVTPVRRRIEPRYQDPETGATWAGRGKRPRWLKGRNPEEFRISPPRRTESRLRDGRENA